MTIFVEHATTPAWPIRECTYPDHARDTDRPHYHVTYGGAEFDPRRRILWNSRVHESMGYHTEQGVRYQHGHTPGVTPTVLDVQAGEHLTRDNCDSRKVTIEFIANRRGDAPLTLQVGCQSFAPGLALNNGGSVSATDDPDKFLVTMTGSVRDTMFSVPTREGGVRTVTLSDLNANILRATIHGSALQQVELAAGVYVCTTPGHDHGVFLLSATGGEPAIARLNSIGYVKGDGFDRWPDCRPVLGNTYLTMFGPSWSRERPHRVQVTSDQFPDRPRVS